MNTKSMIVMRLLVRMIHGTDLLAPARLGVVHKSAVRSELEVRQDSEALAQLHCSSGHLSSVSFAKHTQEGRGRRGSGARALKLI